MLAAFEIIDPYPFAISRLLIFYFCVNGLSLVGLSASAKVEGRHWNRNADSV